MRRPLALLLLTLVVAGCALSPPRVSTDRLAEGDALGATELNFGGVLEVAAGLRPLEGQAVLCGAWAGRTYYARYYGDLAIAAGVVEIEGLGRVHNLSFMTEMRDGLAPGGMSGCRALGRPWEAADAARAVRIRMPYIIVERDCEDGLFGCMITSFRQIAYPTEL
ncbi:MAG: hypothetical protein AAGC57_11290 [Pseudomonadota bacterium]